MKTKAPIKPKTANSIKANVIGKFKNHDAKLESAIDGMTDSIYRVTACSEHIGYVKLPDGRKAKVTITVDADKDNW